MTGPRLSAEERELNRRRRVVAGWRFIEDLPAKTCEQILDYLNGGPVPEGYERIDAAMGQRHPEGKVR